MVKFGVNMLLTMEKNGQTINIMRAGMLSQKKSVATPKSLSWHLLFFWFMFFAFCFYCNFEITVGFGKNVELGVGFLVVLGF